MEYGAGSGRGPSYVYIACAPQRSWMLNPLVSALATHHIVRLVVSLLWRVFE
jgi:hypothetical protein